MVAARETRQDIMKVVEQIAREFRPQRVILFGSHAYGAPTPDSDVDLLVVMPVEGKEVYKAAEIRKSIDHPFPMDLLVRTPQNLQWRLEQGDFFLREIVEKGQVLYEAADAGVGR